MPCMLPLHSQKFDEYGFLSWPHGDAMIDAWANGRSESSAKVMAAMQQGADKLQACSPANDALYCRALHRLATYADHLYRAAEDHLKSQEWQTAQEVIRQKTAEVGMSMHCFAMRTACRVRPVT